VPAQQVVNALADSIPILDIRTTMLKQPLM
jgi:hypothetical protein